MIFSTKLASMMGRLSARANGSVGDFPPLISLTTCFFPSSMGHSQRWLHQPSQGFPFGLLLVISGIIGRLRLSVVGIIDSALARGPLGKPVVDTSGEEGGFNRHGDVVKDDLYVANRVQCRVQGIFMCTQ